MGLGMKRADILSGFCPCIEEGCGAERAARAVFFDLILGLEVSGGQVGVGVGWSSATEVLGWVDGAEGSGSAR